MNQNHTPNQLSNTTLIVFVSFMVVTLMSFVNYGETEMEHYNKLKGTIERLETKIVNFEFEAAVKNRWKE